MVAKYALLDAAESQRWDWTTVQRYIDQMPRDAQEAPSLAKPDKSLVATRSSTQPEITPNHPLWSRRLHARTDTPE